MLDALEAGDLQSIERRRIFTSMKSSSWELWKSTTAGHGANAISENFKRNADGADSEYGASRSPVSRPDKIETLMSVSYDVA
jgi:hypothetical protein